jgi:hypothetical protein
LTVRVGGATREEGSKAREGFALGERGSGGVSRRRRRRRRERVIGAIRRRRAGSMGVLPLRMGGEVPELADGRGDEISS